MLCFQTKPPPDFSDGGSLTIGCAWLFCAARHLDWAAATAAAAIIRARGRTRCADQRQGRYDHQEIFHGILLLCFLLTSSRKLRDEPP